MLRALEMGTAGLKAPTGEAVDFPTNTSDALMSGGSDAIAGAVERMHRKLHRHTGEAPVLIMSGGASVKLDSITELHARDGRDPDLRRPAAAAGEAAGALGARPRPRSRTRCTTPQRRSGDAAMPAARTSSSAATAAATGCASTAASRCPARRRRMSCRCRTPMPPRSIRRRRSSRRCRAATCSGSSTSRPGAGFCVDRYADAATGVMRKNEAGQVAMTVVVLHPAVEFSGEKLPRREPRSSGCTTRRTTPASSPTR